jgi:hypothetical protein
MKLRHYLFLCSLFVIASCGTKYDAPPSVSSVGYEVSGMRFIPKVGTPGSVAKVLNEKLTLARYTFTLLGHATARSLLSAVMIH